MPVKVSRRKDKFRIIEPGGKLAKNLKGTPLDGGGHDTKELADKQAKAINASLAARGE